MPRLNIDAYASSNYKRSEAPYNFATNSRSPFSSLQSSPLSSFYNTITGLARSLIDKVAADSNPLSPKFMATSQPQNWTSNIRFIMLCAFWYTTSALSSNTGKTIMQRFRYPVTLTFIQFGFVAMYCLIFMTPVIRFTRMRSPNRAILKSTLPMGVFQVGGHIFSSIAISRISVSTVHTIKALSPLFTVAAYAILFGVSYSSKTYISLLPLTIGVMLACSFDMSASNIIGLLCAFGSALVFVSSNIFFKKIMPSNAAQTSHKLDKLNLLLYSSSTAFLLMIPVWIYYDLPVFLSAAPVSQPPTDVATYSSYSVPYYFFVNGTVHFAQNLIAFVILSSTSPVTYSIASLFKRVAVICMAIVWFNQTVHFIQGMGILLTFLGLHMYNNAKGDVEKGEKQLKRIEAARDLQLPSTSEDVTYAMTQEANPYSRTGINIPAAGAGATRVRGQTSSGITSRYFQPPGPRIQTQEPSRPRHNTTYVSKPQTQWTSAAPSKSYPSPPPSLDSPPSSTRQLDFAERTGREQLEDVQIRLGPALEGIESSDFGRIPIRVS